MRSFNRKPLLAVGLVLAGLICPGLRQAIAAEVEVDLELVLAVDVSLSMDLEEQKLQRRGYVAAFRHPDVVRAIRAGNHGKIAVTYVEWAGVGRMQTTIEWSLIHSAETAAFFADRLAAAPILRALKTSISGAMTVSAGFFRDNGYRGVRRVIDISGDGPNNEGAVVTVARDAVVARGITVNGLPILLKPGQKPGFFDIKNLDDYYEDCVIGGFGAFILPVRDLREFAVAFRRKLLLEIAGALPRIVPAQAAGPTKPRADCLIGEKLWELWLEEQIHD